MERQVVEEVWRNKLLHPDLRAGGWIRLLAAFYDFVIIGIFIAIFGGASTIWMLITTESPYIGDPVMTRQYILENEIHLIIITWSIIFVVIVFLQLFYSTWKKQSFGMTIVDLALCDENTGDITRMQYFKRELWKIILFPTFFMSFGRDRRTLYDKLSKTYLMK